MKIRRITTAVAVVALVLVTVVQLSVPVFAAKTKTMTGTVVDASMNSMLIHNSQGKDIAFAKTDNSTMPKQGTRLGDKVTITYQVKDGVNDIVKDKLVKRAKMVTGVVQDGTTMNSLMIKDTKKTEYCFYYAGAYVDADDGIMIGDQVQIYYYNKNKAVMVVELAAK